MSILYSLQSPVESGTRPTRVLLKEERIFKFGQLTVSIVIELKVYFMSTYRPGKVDVASCMCLNCCWRWSSVNGSRECILAFL